MFAKVQKSDKSYQSIKRNEYSCKYSKRRNGISNNIVENNCDTIRLLNCDNTPNSVIVINKTVQTHEQTCNVKQESVNNLRNELSN